MSKLSAVVTFERTDVRRAAFLLLLAAAVLSPNIGTPGALPAVRMEQVILLILLPSLGLYSWEQRGLLGIGFVDYAFLALGVAMAITLVVAPQLVADVGWSLRDPFELARVAEYWFLYRMGLTVVADRGTAVGTTATLFGLTVMLTVFSVAQYVLGTGGFNSAVTSTWAVAHNLDGVERTGRVVGTIGNANYYGAFSGFLLIFALGFLLVRRPVGMKWQMSAYVVAFAATLSVVMAQSRTATFALLGALFLGLLFVAVFMRWRAAYVGAIGCFVVSAVLSIGFVQAVQPEVGSWATRFQPEGLTSDSSLSIRISRWRSVFSGFFAGRPSLCEGERLETRPPAGGHEARMRAGSEPPDAAALARDEQRRSDVVSIAQATLDYFCSEGSWPVRDSLEEALVPGYIDALPVDPLTGEAYLRYVAGGGFLIGAGLEDATDPEGPVFTLGTIPNFALNPSYESGEDAPSRWETTEGAVALVARSQGMFAESAALLHLPPGGSFLHRVVFEFGLDVEYVVATWVRPVGDEPVEFQVYLAAALASGEVLDPFAAETVTLDPADGWQRVVLPMRTPEEGRIGVLRVIFRAGGDSPIEVLVDGTTVSQGTFAPSFTRVRDVDPSGLDSPGLPGFSDSPVIGAGPRKDIELGTVDNEYLLFLDRYGLMGAMAYVALFVGAFRVALGTWRTDSSFVSLLALSIMVFTVMMAVFNITAGSFYHFQIMAVYWLLVGLLARAWISPDRVEASG